MEEGDQAGGREFTDGCAIPAPGVTALVTGNRGAVKSTLLLDLACDRIRVLETKGGNDA